MKNLLSLLLVSLSFFALADGNYRYNVNLTKVVNDKITVTLIPPDIESNEIDFLPSIPQTVSRDRLYPSAHIFVLQQGHFLEGRSIPNKCVSTFS